MRSLINFVLVVALVSCNNSNRNYNEDIKIVPIQDIQSVNDLVNYKDLKNKVLYINFWNVESDPSVLELSYYTELEKKYMNEDLEFVFLSTRSNNSFDNLKWEKTIRKFNLKGYHIQNNNLVIDLLNYRKAKNDTFPIFILFDKKGGLNKTKAAKPSDKNELYKQIEALL